MPDSDENEDDTSVETNYSCVFEGKMNAMIDKILGSDYAEVVSSVYIADQDFYGFQVVLVCREDAWIKLFQVLQAVSEGEWLEELRFVRKVGQLIAEKCALFWESLK